MGIGAAASFGLLASGAIAGTSAPSLFYTTLTTAELTAVGDIFLQSQAGYGYDPHQTIEAFAQGAAIGAGTVLGYRAAASVLGGRPASALSFTEQRFMNFAENAGQSLAQMPFDAFQGYQTGGVDGAFDQALGGMMLSLATGSVLDLGISGTGQLIDLGRPHVTQLANRLLTTTDTTGTPVFRRNLLGQIDTIYSESGAPLNVTRRDNTFYSENGNPVFQVRNNNNGTQTIDLVDTTYWPYYSRLRNHFEAQGRVYPNTMTINSFLATPDTIFNPELGAIYSLVDPPLIPRRSLSGNVAAFTDSEIAAAQANGVNLSRPSLFSSENLTLNEINAITALSPSGDPVLDYIIRTIDAEWHNIEPAFLGRIQDGGTPIHNRRARVDMVNQILENIWLDPSFQREFLSLAPTQQSIPRIYDAVFIGVENAARTRAVVAAAEGITVPLTGVGNVIPNAKGQMSSWNFMPIHNNAFELTDNGLVLATNDLGKGIGDTSIAFTTRESAIWRNTPDGQEFFVFRRDNPTTGNEYTNINLETVNSAVFDAGQFSPIPWNDIYTNTVAYMYFDVNGNFYYSTIPIGEIGQTQITMPNR